MGAPILLFATLAAIAPLAILAKWLKLPYPIVFVIGGALIAFVPALPHLQIAPDWIFYTVLPPLLFHGGWVTDWTLLRRNVRPIALLAVALVVVSTAAVAATIEWIAPGFGWASAFVLGAIVSPPDAVAASAIFERFSVPRRIGAILDGEGLLNDGTALVIYRFAVVAAVLGRFSLPRASIAFVVVVTVGIAAGVVFALAVEWLLRLLRRLELGDSQLDVLIGVIAPYVTYLTADALGGSGVLATVTVGIILGRRSTQFFSPESRLISGAVWNVLIYLLNALVFLLIGIELRTIVADGTIVSHWLPAALWISLVLIVLRMVWVFAQALIPRAFRPGERLRDPAQWRWLVLIGWTGLRGIVSLAAALALPLEDAHGAEFPERTAIIFITFCVIVVTLVGQGLSLIPLLYWLKLDADEDTTAYETKVRIAALEAGLKRLEALAEGSNVEAEREPIARAVAEYRNRIDHLSRHVAPGQDTESEESRFDHKIQEEALAAERHAIAQLRNDGRIPDDIFRRVQYDLDLAATRLV
ncbi:MAG: Na+/H+ antiporter [Candidatus Lustribacter sp.]|jgi:CPA1 family monovalent cation:H+ antiporter